MLHDLTFAGFRERCLNKTVTVEEIDHWLRLIKSRYGDNHITSQPRTPMGDNKARMLLVQAVILEPKPIESFTYSNPNTDSNTDTHPVA